MRLFNLLLKSIITAQNLTLRYLDFNLVFLRHLIPFKLFWFYFKRNYGEANKKNLFVLLEYVFNITIKNVGHLNTFFLKYIIFVGCEAKIIN